MITVVGSLNMDLFIGVPRFPVPGETILGGEARRGCGGKGANQAVAIARMGHAATLVGAVGDDPFGDEMLARLDSAGVDTTAVLRRPGVPTGLAMIVLDRAGQNQIVVSSGANDTFTAADLERCRDQITASDALLVQLETPLPTVRAALEIARKAGKLTVLNPAPFVALDDELLQLCDFIIPNENEASELSGLPVRDLKSAALAAEAIYARSRWNVLVTLGANGAWLRSRDFTGHVPGLPVTPKDTVGAGDAFIGAFVVRLVEGAPVQQAANFACAAAAIAVTRRGAQDSFPARAELEQWLSLRIPPPA
jgi:ribokinase